MGKKGTTELLVLSQVILSMQLSFAVVPLVMFTSDKAKMGEFVNKPFIKTCVWIISFVIIILNLYLLYQTFFGE
jgi:manganese transport protein